MILFVGDNIGFFFIEQAAQALSTAGGIYLVRKPEPPDEEVTPRSARVPVAGVEAQALVGRVSVRTGAAVVAKGSGSKAALGHCEVGAGAMVAALGIEAESKCGRPYVDAGLGIVVKLQGVKMSSMAGIASIRAIDMQKRRRHEEEVIAFLLAAND